MGLFVDDQHPLAGGGKSVEGVLAGGNEQVANVKRDRGDEGGGGVCSGAPDLAVGDDFRAADVAAT